MATDYYPYLDKRFTCHNVLIRGGCTFCAYHFQKISLSPEPVTIKEMKKHFDDYARNNDGMVIKQGRLIIAPKGSWFTEVPKSFRDHIYKFTKRHGVGLKYETRASLFNEESARRDFNILNSRKFRNNPEKIKNATKQALETLVRSLEEINPTHTVSLGLEVANDSDLETINKGCSLNDYVLAAEFIHRKDTELCCNILVAPPGVEDPEYKALETARFAVEELGAIELMVMPCIPMKKTKAHKDWVEATWNPISSTASSEVLRIIRGRYPSVPVRYQDLRVFNFHGRFGEFTRKHRPWSDKEKLQERKRVRKIAEKHAKDFS